MRARRWCVAAALACLPSLAAAQTVLSEATIKRLSRFQMAKGAAFVLITATSFEVLIGEVSFFSSAATITALNSARRRMANFMLTNDTNGMSCRVLQLRSGIEP